MRHESLGSANDFPTEQFHRIASGTSFCPPVPDFVLKFR